MINERKNCALSSEIRNTKGKIIGELGLGNIVVRRNEHMADVSNFVLSSG